MKLSRACALFLVIVSLFVPVASAGFLENVISTCDQIIFTTVHDTGEIVYPTGVQGSGTVLDALNMDKTNMDYGTFPASTYGKIVYSNADDPLTRIYQEESVLRAMVSMQDVNQARPTIQINMLLDDGSVEIHSYTFPATEGGLFSQVISFNHEPSYYDANNDGAIRMEIVHPDTADEVNIYSTYLYYTINSSITEPVAEEEEGETVVDDGGSSGGTVTDSSSNTGSSTVTDSDDNTDSGSITDSITSGGGLLFDEPVYTIPGFEAVFAVVGLLIVAWMVRRECE